MSTAATTQTYLLNAMVIGCSRQAEAANRHIACGVVKKSKKVVWRQGAAERRTSPVAGPGTKSRTP